jgi:hypothetical protein
MPSLRTAAGHTTPGQGGVSYSHRTSAIYGPTATGFRVYVQWRHEENLAPSHARQFNFHVNWIGVDNP